MSDSVTQADVARSLGLTQRTVSRVFQSPDLVALKTRNRVLAAAERLGYRPHAMARAMRSQRIGQVVLLRGYSASASHLHQDTMQGLMDGLQDSGYGFGIARLSDHVFGDADALPRAIAEVACDGVFINYDTNVPAALATALDRHRIPAVWINRKRLSDAVYPDDVDAGRLALTHAVERGHREIIYVDMHIGHTNERHMSRDDRLAGVQAAAVELQVTVHTWLPEESIPTGEHTAVAQHQLHQHPEITAVIGYGEFEVSLMQYAATQLGWALPRDLACIVFGERPQFLGYTITTVCIPAQAMGQTAAQMLIDHIDHNRFEQASIALPCQLWAAESTAHPPRLNC